MESLIECKKVSLKIPRLIRLRNWNIPSRIYSGHHRRVCGHSQSISHHILQFIQTDHQGGSETYRYGLNLPHLHFVTNKINYVPEIEKNFQLIKSQPKNNPTQITEIHKMKI